MLLFCPTCSNMLIINRVPARELPPDEQHNAGKHRFMCRTCPYQMILDQPYYERKYMQPQKVDDVLGGADSWKNVDKTGIRCTRPDCDSQEAFFRQVQIRSADEPMTSFYRCVKCSAEWREN